MTQSHPDPAPTPEKTFDLIAASLSKMPGAAHAELRRLRPEDPASPVFWTLVARYIEPHLGGHDSVEKEKCWAVALNALGVLGSLHTPGTRLGHALADAGLAELRLSRLLRARGELLHAEVRRTAQLLASKGKPANAAAFLTLLLNQDDSHPDPKRRRFAETIRRRLARDYFARTHSPQD